MDRINVTKSSLPPLDEYIREIETMWETHWLTNMGEKHEELTKKLSAYLKADNLSLFSNGHMALEFALQALELEGEVITTPFTFASTTHAIVRNGLTPVFCDILSSNCTMDTSTIEALITEKTCAILPVHVYGNVCDLDALHRLSERHGLKLIYDAAHAFGVEVDGQGIGSFGDISMFSFHSTKIFHTIEGGAITCRDVNLLKVLYNLKNFGIADAEHVVAVGGNSKMNEFQAAMGLCNLRHLDMQLQLRADLVMLYRQRLGGLPGIRLLLEEKENIKPNYAYFPVYFDPEVLCFDRDAVFARLIESNIFSRKYFFPLISDFDCYRDRYHASPTPIAQQIAAGVLTLPLYGNLSLSDVDRICDIIFQMTKGR